MLINRSLFRVGWRDGLCFRCFCRFNRLLVDVVFLGEFFGGDFYTKGAALIFTFRRAGYFAVVGFGSASGFLFVA